MNEHAVAITGLGAVTPLGVTVNDFWNGVLAERIAVGPVTRFPTEGYASRIAAEVGDFGADRYLAPRRLRWTDRYAQLTLVAAHEAIADSGAPLRGRTDVGIWIGSALGGVAYAEEQHDIFRAKGLGAVRPLVAISVFGGAATSNVALEWDIRGPTLANANSCASGVVAIGEAFRAIARGDVRAAVAGGVEAPLAPLVFGAFVVIDAMSRRNDEPQAASRPFDAQRDGFVMAEGSGVLVLERLADARARGAFVYATIDGYAQSNDAHHPSAPRPDGSSNAAAIRAALDEAHLGPGDVDVVYAHGSSTPLGDRAEARALRDVFGERAAAMSIVGTKGQHAHALGATGAWETVLAALGLARGVVPRSVNHDAPDAEHPLALTPTRRDGAFGSAVKVAAGFGGINAALVLRAAGN